MFSLGDELMVNISICVFATLIFKNTQVVSLTITFRNIFIIKV